MPAARHTPEQRAEALRLYREQGPHAASRQTGIAVSTIGSWAGRSGVRTVATANTQAATEAAKADTEAQLARLSRTLVRIAVDRADWIAEQPAAKDTRAPMTVAAIAIDKAQLLSGKPTSRIETLAPEADESLDRILELRRSA